MNHAETLTEYNIRMQTKITNNITKNILFAGDRTAETDKFINSKGETRKGRGDIIPKDNALL